MHVMIMTGTRPEVIKMAPVIQKLKCNNRIRVTVCATGQHREILNQAFHDFNITPDKNLNVMTNAQSLGHLSSALFENFDNFLAQTTPDWLLVQGDTTSVMVASLCAFYRNIHVGHVEAGLRSNDMHSPFPEELNRCVATLVSDAHFAPTERARQNLLTENVPFENILLTGNTVVDALLQMLDKLHANPPHMPSELRALLNSNKRLILLTAHRRENHGEKLEAILNSIKRVALQRGDVCFIYPVHPNPAVKIPAQKILADCANIRLFEPFAYPVLLSVMEKVEFILTDSGGIQEEGCVLRKPVLVLRDTTERAEGVEAGAAKLLGADSHAITLWLNRLLDEPELRVQMSGAAGALYGDGKAADRIATYLDKQILH